MVSPKNQNTMGMGTPIASVSRAKMVFPTPSPNPLYRGGPNSGKLNSKSPLSSWPTEWALEAYSGPHESVTYGCMLKKPRTLPTPIRMMARSGRDQCSRFSAVQPYNNKPVGTRMAVAMLGGMRHSGTWSRPVFLRK